VSEIQGVPNCPGCAALRKQLEELREEFKLTTARLEARIVELTNRLNQNSGNSSKPPSSDPPWNKQAHAQPKSQNRPGGQPGHPGHYRVLLSKERVNKTVRFFPKECGHCGALLSPKPQAGSSEPVLHQMLELPEQPLHVTQYEGWVSRCGRCGYVTRAEIPPEIRAHTLGPRLTAFIAVLTGAYHLSQRQVQGFFETAFDASLGLGSITKHEQEVTAAVAPAYEEARQAVQEAPVKHLDETGWSLKGKICWVWVVATVRAAFYQIDKSRGKKGLHAVLRTIKHVLVTDRWHAYSKLPLQEHQFCWAHLRRDFQRFYEMAGRCREVGLAGRRAHRKIFKLWHKFKAGLIERATLVKHMEPVRRELAHALQRGRDSPDKKAQHFCKRILKVYPALWVFVQVEGVEPTNNHAERMMRKPVLWRKGSFGNNSKAGCEFTASILTVVQTLRLQQKPVLEYLTQAVAAVRRGEACPALL
jgi:transposase